MVPNRTVSLWDMLNTNTSWFVRAINLISWCEGVLATNSAIKPQTSTDTVNTIKQMIDHLPPADVPATIAALQNILTAWGKEGGVAKVRLHAMLESVVSNLKAELAGRNMWIMSSSENAIYKTYRKPFGEIVYDNLPTTRDDLSEAAICLSMSRGVACVFHLMRAMEECVGLIAANLTGIRTKKVWGILLSDIKTAADQMPKSIKKTRWLHAHSLLYSVKEAWRNDVMHPRQVYTEEQAREVFDATKAFMRHLASLLRAEAEPP